MVATGTAASNNSTRSVSTDEEANIFLGLIHAKNIQMSTLTLMSTHLAVRCQGDYLFWSCLVTTASYTFFVAVLWYVANTAIYRQDWPSSTTPTT